jgi:hypothetical protein
MNDEESYDRELQEYWKSLENDPKRLAIFESYSSIASAYYPRWLPPRINKNIWRRTVKETVLSIMMIQEYEEVRKKNKNSIVGQYHGLPQKRPTEENMKGGV